jgi:hypothetical protein
MPLFHPCSTLHFHILLADRQAKSSASSFASSSSSASSREGTTSKSVTKPSFDVDVDQTYAVSVATTTATATAMVVEKPAEALAEATLVADDASNSLDHTDSASSKLVAAKVVAASHSSSDLKSLTKTRRWQAFRAIFLSK